MGLVAKIARDAGISVRHTASMELISAKDLAAFLEAARTRQAYIVGLEGFRSAEGQIIPDMDAIADFTALADAPDGAERTIAEALRFLSEVKSPDLFYDVIVREQ